MASIFGSGFLPLRALASLRESALNCLAASLASVSCAVAVMGLPRGPEFASSADGVRSAGARRTARSSGAARPTERVITCVARDALRPDGCAAAFPRRWRVPLVPAPAARPSERALSLEVLDDGGVKFS